MTVKELLQSTVDTRLYPRIYTVMSTSKDVTKCEIKEYIKPINTIKELFYGDPFLNAWVEDFKEVENAEVDYWSIELRNSHLEIWIAII